MTGDLTAQHAKHFAVGYRWVTVTATECVYGRDYAGLAQSIPEALPQKLRRDGKVQAHPGARGARGRTSSNPTAATHAAAHVAALQAAARGAGGQRRNPAADLTASDKRLVAAADPRAHLVASVDGTQLAGWTGQSELEFEIAVRDLIASQGKDLHRPAVIHIRRRRVR